VPLRVRSTIALLLLLAASVTASPAEALFLEGARAYRTADYVRAAWAFGESAARQPAAGTLQNLGNAQWQLGQVGPAILAWEQALWVDPFDQPARGNLRYARKVAQIESPELAWSEVVSTWLPANWWTWITGASLWLAVGMGVLPGILRQRKAAWHQALAAFGLMVFLLSVPANVGVHTRTRIGFVLQRDTPLRLTPTREGQPITRLGAGEPARLERARGRYLLIRTGRSLGWVEQGQFGLICPQG